MQVKTIAEQLFFTTVRIDTIAPDGSQGSGTGFFFTHKIDEREYPFIVTNKHVIMGTKEGVLSFIQRKDGEPELGNGLKLQITDNWANIWFVHPSSDVDIAICPLNPVENEIKQSLNIDIFYRSIPSSCIPSIEQIRNLDAIEDVLFIGYPNGIWDRKNLLPVARRGITASPIEIDFEGRPIFIIDASVFGGSSGSPIFILKNSGYQNRDGNFIVGQSQFLFLGVVSAVYYRTLFNEIIPMTIPTQLQPMAKQQEMIDLGIVIKAKTIVEAIEAFIIARQA